MKIVFLSRSLAFGGAERQLTVLASGLRRRGHDVVVACFYPDIPLAAVLQSAGVPVHVIGKDGRWNVIGFTKRLIQFLRSESPEVIHTYLPVPNILAAVIRPAFPAVPLVWGVRSSNVDLTKFDLLTRMTYGVEPWLARFADLLIVNSEAGRRHCLTHGYPESKMKVIPNGVPVDEFLTVAEERARLRQEWNVAGQTPLIGMVARIDPLKDHPTFLRAAKRVSERRVDVRFACVGGGDPERVKRLKEMAHEIGLGDRVIWAGARADVRAVYNACDVICSSSTTEGFPNTLAEAMACGTPCVASDAGDSRLIVGDTGKIVPLADDAAMAAALLDVLARAECLGDCARTRIVMHFSVEALLQRTTDALEALVR